ncbi:MAG TPA: PLP-dependent transferase, partial [Acidimicrobiales bacterium]
MTRARDDRGFETRAIHAGQDPDPFTGAVVPPISISTTFAQQGVGRHSGWEYSRSANPTRASLEMCLASLEGAKHGFAFASGMAAEDAVLRQLRPGAAIALGGDAYGGTFRLIDKVYGASGHPWTAVDLTDPAALDKDWPAGTALVWAETPTNPTMAIVDIAAMAEVTH